jgi:hypothetical protein
MALAENRVAPCHRQFGVSICTGAQQPQQRCQGGCRTADWRWFDVVPAADVTQSEMRRVIGDFAARVVAKGPDTVAVVYYAGHGVHVPARTS